MIQPPEKYMYVFVQSCYIYPVLNNPIVRVGVETALIPRKV